MRRLWVPIALALAVSPLTSQQVTLPNHADALKMLVFGDSGTGGRAQYELARMMDKSRARFSFQIALMLGDNMYGFERASDYLTKFERPYKPLLDAGVKFYAALGNHDNRDQRFYKPFNMDGKTYYTFKAPKQDVRFFVLETDYMDRRQLEWLETELRRANEKWKICYFHHPLYSSGARHGSDLGLRQVLEPLFLKYSVDAVFSGHEHFYERLRPQKGITYFTSGGAGKLRRGNIREGALTARGFDTDYHFMLVEIRDDDLSFQVISRAGQTVDSGTIHPVSDTPSTQP